MRGFKFLKILVCLLILENAGLAEDIENKSGETVIKEDIQGENGFEFIRKAKEKLINKANIEGEKNGINIDLSEEIEITNEGNIVSDGNGIFNHQGRNSKITNEGNIVGEYGILEQNEEKSKVYNSGIIKGIKAALFRENSRDEVSEDSDYENYGLLIGGDQVDDVFLEKNHGTSIVLNSDGTVNYRATKIAENYEGQIEINGKTYDGIINDASAEDEIIGKIINGYEGAIKNGSKDILVENSKINSYNGAAALNGNGELTLKNSTINNIGDNENIITGNGEDNNLSLYDQNINGNIDLGGGTDTLKLQGKVKLSGNVDNIENISLAEEGKVVFDKKTEFQGTTSVDGVFKIETDKDEVRFHNLVIGKKGDIETEARVLIIDGYSDVDRDCIVKKDKTLRLYGTDNNINGDTIVNQNGTLDLKAGARITFKNLILKDDGRVLLEEGADLEIEGTTESTKDYTLEEGRILGINGGHTGILTIDGLMKLGGETTMEGLVLENQGKLEIKDNSSITLDGTADLENEFTLNNGSCLTLKGKNNKLKSSIIDGLLNLDEDSNTMFEDLSVTKKGKVVLAGENTMLGESYIYGTLESNEDGLICVGDENNQGKLSIANANLNGGTLFLDPSWEDQNDISGSSLAGIENFTSGAIDGKLVVGQNSVLALGSPKADWVVDSFNNSTLSWGNRSSEVGAALAIAKPMTLGSTGGIKVDGSLTSPEAIADGSVYFADDSALVLDVTGIGDDYALYGNNIDLTVEPGSKILLTNAVQGKTINIISGMNGGTDETLNWAGNLYSDDRMIDMSTAKIENGVLSEIENSKDILPKVKLKNAIVSIWDNKQNDTNSPNKGIAFLSKAMSKTIVPEEADAINAINSSAQLSELGGHQRALYDAGNRISAAIFKHNFKEKDEDFWYDFSDGKTKLDGVCKNNWKNSTIGKDLFSDDINLGMALSIGKGNVSSASGYEDTRNDYDYFGLNVYYTEETENSNLIGDFGVVTSSGKIEQNNLLGNINGDIDSKLLTLGVNAKSKKTYKNITPYAGVRFVRLETDNFDTSILGGKMYQTSCKTQNMFLVPIGVTYEEGIESKYGKIVPSLNLELLTVFGDKDVDNTVTVNGVNASDTISSNIIDGNTLIGNFGVGIEKENMSYGIRYQLRTSSKISSNNIGLNFEYDL